MENRSGINDLSQITSDKYNYFFFPTEGLTLHFVVIPLWSPQNPYTHKHTNRCSTLCYIPKEQEQRKGDHESEGIWGRRYNKEVGRSKGERK